MLGSLAMVTLILLRVLMARSERWRTSWRGAALAGEPTRTQAAA
jgi:hypothetical protein